ncbi:MAG: ATP-binding protein [Lachnospiraceae bacterium]|nr:ATP-binding protein [Bacteroides sp.]MCM1222261.1 ATP-binding protein [Lachnospiraceae bacterium]
MGDADLSFAVEGLPAYVSAITFLYTVVAPALMIANKLPKRSKFPLRCISCLAVLAFVSELFTCITDLLLQRNPDLIQYILYFLTFKFLYTFLLTCTSVQNIYNVGFWDALFCVTAGYCLQHMQAKIGAIIMEFVIKVELFWVYETLINLLIATLFYALFYFLFLRKQKKVASYAVSHGQVALAACVVGVNIFYNSFGIAYLSLIVYDLRTAGIETATADQLMIFIYIMSMLVAMLALALDFSTSFTRHLQVEKEALNKILEEGKKQYEYEKRNAELINLKCHDLKHQLASMKGKIYEEQIEELTEAINIYDGDIKTGNEALDVVLAQKSLYCSHHGIRLTCLLNGENYHFIPIHELYALFNNAIDNAIEAVEKLPEEKRIISVTETVSGGLINLRIENYFDGELNYKDGLPQTNKEGDGHGYGVKSIKMLAEKNGGGISIKATDDTFTLNIFFSVEKAPNFQAESADGCNT